MGDRPDYYYNQSAVIPYRQTGQELEIFLITSRKKVRWIIPKGVIDPGYLPPDSAAKEAMEEAGIQGTIYETPIGIYKYEKWGGVCTVQVFIMEVDTVLEVWEESFRDREWLPLAEAASRLREDELKDIVRSLPTFLAQLG